MNNKSKYNMTFTEVLNEIFETHGWYQGENFANGAFITADNDTDIVELIQFKMEEWLGAKKLDDLIIYPAITRQKYRRCYTQPEIERKV